jgi:hypothetical protein
MNTKKLSVLALTVLIAFSNTACSPKMNDKDRQEMEAQRMIEIAELSSAKVRDDIDSAADKPRTRQRAIIFHKNVINGYNERLGYDQNDFRYSDVIQESKEKYN